MNTGKRINFQLIGFFTIVLFLAVATLGQDKPDSTKMKHKMHKSMMMDHSKMDSTHHSKMNHSMTDSTKHSKMKHSMMDSSKHSKMMDEKSSPKDRSEIVREGPIDLYAIDKNGDKKVFQDQMDWNVISDEPGECPLCGMTLKEISIYEAKVNLIMNGFKIK